MCMCVLLVNKQVSKSNFNLYSANSLDICLLSLFSSNHLKEDSSSELVYLELLHFPNCPNDVANSFGTSVGSKVLTLQQACVLATIFECLGAVLLGSRVSETIRKGIIDQTLFEGHEVDLMLGNVSALTGCCIWLLVATFFKLPVSGTHSIVGATLGFALVAHGDRGVEWGKFGLIVASWFISPLLSGAVSAGLFALINRFVLQKPNPMESGLCWLPFFYGFAILTNLVSIFVFGPKYLNIIPLYGRLIVVIAFTILIMLGVWFIAAPRIRKTANAIDSNVKVKDIKPSKKIGDRFSNIWKKKKSSKGSSIVNDNIVTSENMQLIAAEQSQIQNKIEEGTQVDQLTILKSIDDDDSEVKKSEDGLHHRTLIIANNRTRRALENCYYHNPHAAFNMENNNNSNNNLCIYEDLGNNQKNMIRILLDDNVIKNRFPRRFRQNNGTRRNHSFSSRNDSYIHDTLPQQHYRNESDRLKKNLSDTGDTFLSHYRKTYDANTLSTVSSVSDVSQQLRRTNNEDVQFLNPTYQKDGKDNEKDLEDNNKMKTIASEEKDPPKTKQIFSFLQILTAIFGSFAHGGNDVSNAIGPLIGLWIVWTNGKVSPKADTPLWVLFYGGVGISIGLWIWGRRVIKTIGEDLTKITPSSGFVIEIASAFTVLVASNIGIPVSTTHCKVGSVVFTGLVRSRKGVQWSIFRNIVMAWLVTVPVSGGIAAAVFASSRKLLQIYG
ncbi:hypothetical protein SNEBB_010170 [Seison nebaliae]|nr:hypothetical protein SNEBB_010170 [Seison nebaliae]